MTTPTYHFDGILFDCDSTLSSIEGIDELAALNNQKQTIAQLTNQAMNGDLPLQAIYEKRLQHIQPTQQQIQQIAQQYLKTITQGAETLIATLQRHNILVGIISGGLYDAILPLAQHLNIPTQHLHAVHLNYTPEGHYHSIQPTPLTTTNGKHTIAQQWKQQNHLNRIALIGDGISDIAAKGAADTIIGYGGIIDRPQVRQHADHHHTDPNLLSLLPYLQNPNNI